mgnify:CR=1 FL=1
MLPKRVYTICLLILLQVVVGRLYAQPSVAIETAKENENVKGIFIKAGTFSAGQAGIKELRDALKDFKSSGKFIVSYGEYYTEGGYFLSSISDDIYINPSGLMEFNGFASEVVFFKGMFEKLEIERLTPSFINQMYGYFFMLKNSAKFC